MFSDDRSFEDEVTPIARLLWPEAEYGGAALEDDRERDGVFISEDFVQLVECTMSRSKDKAVADVGKLTRLIQRMRNKYPTRAVRGWFVTLHEPTADQRQVANKHARSIVALSFD